MKFQMITPCHCLVKRSFGRWIDLYVLLKFQKHQTRSIVHSSPMSVQPCRLCGEPGHRAMQCPYLVSDDEMIVPDDVNSLHSQQSHAMGSEGRHRPPPQWTESEMAAFQRRVIAEAKAEAKAKYPPRKPPQAADGWERLMMGQPQVFSMAAGDEEFQLTEAEIQMLKKKRERKSAAQAKAKEKKALTGQLADYPSLSHCWSSEVALNIAACARSRMVTFLWKKLLWQLRVKMAVEVTYPRASWRRNP